MFLRCLAFLLLLAVAATPLRAEQPIPPSDADILRLQTAAESLLASGRQCIGGPCLETDCALAVQSAAALDEAETLLLFMEAWVTDARRDALRHYQTLMEEIIRKGDRQANLEGWLAWQDFFQTFGKVMLDIASISDWVEDSSSFLADALGPQGKWTDVLHAAEEIDGVLELANNTLGSIDTLAQKLLATGSSIPPAMQTLLDGKNLGSEAKGLALRLRDAKRLADAAAASGDEVLKIASRQQVLKSLRNAAQILGKIGLMVAESAQQEMKDEIDELARLQGEEQLTASKAFLEWQRVAARSEAVLTTLEALKGQLETYAPCTAGCTAWLRRPLPQNNFDGYGRALLYFNGRIAHIADELAQLDSRYKKERLGPLDIAVERNVYHPGERVTALFRVPQCLVDSASIDLTDNLGVLSSLSLTGTPEGYVDYGAPAVFGDYSLVIKLPGREAPLAETGFVVVDPNLPLEPMVELVPTQPYPPPGADWTPPEDRSTWVEDCRAINCDCDHLDFGLLTGEYRKECRAAEALLVAQCNQEGHIKGTCHTTAQGPNAFPK